MPHSPPRHNAGRSQASRLAQQKDYNRYNRTGRTFYDSMQWRRLRAWFKKRNPICEICREQGRATTTQAVDHIVPIKAGGAPLDENNLRSLCIPCHNRVTAQQAVEYKLRGQSS